MVASHDELDPHMRSYKCPRTGHYFHCAYCHRANCKACQSRNPEQLRKEIKDILTNGWTQHERGHWHEYLEEEVKPYYPELYEFLKEVSKDVAK